VADAVIEADNFTTKSGGIWFFGQKPRSMFATILESVELPPAPLSPPRRA